MRSLRSVLDDLDGRSRAKAEQVLNGAKSAFLELGFEGASVYEIAKRAGVSKGTVYTYFPDKEALFSAVVEEEIRMQAENMAEAVSSDGDAVMDVFRLVRRLLEYLVSPVPLELFRIVVAESARFPALGRLFYKSGPSLGMTRIADTLVGMEAGGHEDPMQAAKLLSELTKGDFFLRRLLKVDEDSPTPEQLDEAARAVTLTFSRVYPTRKKPRGTGKQRSRRSGGG